MTDNALTIPVSNSSAMIEAGAIADQYASDGVFEDYRQRTAANTAQTS